MEDLTDLKKYLKKLQNTIARDIDFKFLGMNFIKKNKIDDVWCCILASLPEIFKKNLKSTFSKKLNSIIAYNHLFNALKHKCPFSSEMYSVNVEGVNHSITTILTSIERDVNYLEKNT